MKLDYLKKFVPLKSRYRVFKGLEQRTDYLYLLLQCTTHRKHLKNLTLDLHIFYKQKAEFCFSVDKPQDLFLNGVTEFNNAALCMDIKGNYKIQLGNGGIYTAERLPDTTYHIPALKDRLDHISIPYFGALSIVSDIISRVDGGSEKVLLYKNDSTVYFKTNKLLIGVSNAE